VIKNIHIRATNLTAQTVTEAIRWSLTSSTEKAGLQAHTELRQWQRWVMNGQWAASSIRSDQKQQSTISIIFLRLILLFVACKSAFKIHFPPHCDIV